MTIKMIVATGENFEIGVDNKLLWDLPEDMEYFSGQTGHSVVIMGRSTFDSLNLPNGLKGRRNIVITNKPNKYKHINSVGKNGYHLVFTDINRAVLDLAEERFRDVWVIGGAQIYEQFIDFIDEVHWTQIKKGYQEANKFLTDKTIDEITEFSFDTKVKSCYDEKSDTHFTINILKRIK